MLLLVLFLFLLWSECVETVYFDFNTTCFLDHHIVRGNYSSRFPCKEDNTVQNTSLAFKSVRNLKSFMFRKLLLIGDSLTSQMFLHTLCSIDPFELSVELSHHIVAFHYTDISKGQVQFNRVNLTLNRHFLRAIQKTDENTAIVFNQGAWFSTFRLNTTEDGVKELFERSTRMIIKALRNVKAMFFFGQILPVHAYCPTKSIHKAHEDLVAKMWTLYPELNKILVRLAANADISTINYESVLSPHADKHKPNDCMHWCTGKYSPLVAAAAHILSECSSKFGLNKNL